MTALRSMNTIERFLQTIGATKSAAEANTEPGSIGGETSHPVKDVDDATEDAKEGERSAENAADVKADQGSPGVDSTKENVAVKSAARKKASDGKSSDGGVNPPGTAADDQLQIGLTQAATGDQPEVETSSAKPGKEDSETTHPARTDNDELDGEKYASMSIEKLAAYTDKLGNQLLLMISETLEDAPAKTASAKQTATKQAAGSPDLAGQAGWELAGLFSGDFDKQAADKLVGSTLEAMIKQASDDADNVVAHLQKIAAAKTKPQPRRLKRANDPMAAGGGMPPGPPPAAMAGGEEMPPEMGMGGGEEMPPEMGGGEEMPPEGGGDDVAQLLEIMEQLGITVEDLQAAAQDGGEEMPPEMGGGEMPPEDEAGAAPGMEVEASDKSQRPAKKNVKAGGQKAANAAVDMQRYINEIVSRSRT